MGQYVNNTSEWLEADGLGGFAMGTVSGIRTRRYHGLLLCATVPPSGRVMLVNGVDASINTASASYALTSQRYFPDVVQPDGSRRIARFDIDPWPTWIYLLEDGTEVEHSVFVANGGAVVMLSWRMKGTSAQTKLSVRPFLSGRDYHSLHKENPSFRFDATVSDRRVSWQPYSSIPAVSALSNGRYQQRPEWYRNFFYEEEQVRGLDATEDLGSPGVFEWDLSKGEAVLVFYAEGHHKDVLSERAPFDSIVKDLRSIEQDRRRHFSTRLHRSADAYIVRRGKGKTIVAGYPWFTDWGRDTFIAMRGLCMTAGRLDVARQILLQWAGEISEGMLPNYFHDRDEEAEFNSVDASLWYVIAIHEFFQTMKSRRMDVLKEDRRTLQAAVELILSAYERGTRYGIRLDKDGLLMAGVPGMQLTWMDVKTGDRVVTPRIGKPVEVQALWLNALKIASEFSPRWKELFNRGQESFVRRFWNEEDGFLFDVVDVQHQMLTADASFRPNQIFAVGGLPHSLLDKERAKRVVAAVEERLWTPAGLRSLAPGENGYCGHYEGNAWERDNAYHQGTVWPWLTTSFVEAWLRVRGSSALAKKEAREKFLMPLLARLDEAGIGHVSEIADAEPPHTPRGCPFQAWSTGELLRLAYSVLEE